MNGENSSPPAEDMHPGSEGTKIDTEKRTEPERGSRREGRPRRRSGRLAAWLLLAVFTVSLCCSGLGIYTAWRLNVYRYAGLSDLKYARFRELCKEDAWSLFVDTVFDGGADYRGGSASPQRNVVLSITDWQGNLLERGENFTFYFSRSPYVYGFVCEVQTLEGGGGNLAYVREYAVRGNSMLEEAWEFAVGDPDLSDGAAGETPGLRENQYAVAAAVRLDGPYYDAYYYTDRGTTLLWNLRYTVFYVAGLSLALVLACFVALLRRAGRTEGGEAPSPGRLDGVPFDLLTLIALLLEALLLGGAGELSRSLLENYERLLLLGAAVIPCAVLVFIAWCCALVRRLRQGGWWRRTLIYGLLHGLRKGLGGLRRGTRELLRRVPLVWKTALGLLLYGLLRTFVMFRLYFEPDLLTFLLLLEGLAVFLLALRMALILRRLQAGGEALAAGNLQYHTDLRGLHGEFRRHGENLNSISEGMARAVEERLRSERLKTELITNVSHDLKTPLTSLINYVDLLQRNTEPERTAEYLEVLDRQTRKLKKLTEDLVEMSKASTGNLEFHPRRNSVSELLRQAAGEYSERLEAAGLEPVLTLPERDLFVWADGTLLWRVTDNLISNACKYSQPGTRFYLEAAEAPEEGKVSLTFKNISRDRLSKTPEELMERFVRGDSARSGEGSGLGLNIARSLTELQGGTFRFLLDGDLFKAELLLPAAEEEPEAGCKGFTQK